MEKPLRSLKREIAGVRRNDDLECVHRMRVASRRLRNALALFGDELPAAARDSSLKRLKRVTKSLGAARDLDVQIDFLKGYLAALGTRSRKDRPGIEHVLAALTARRAAAQADVLAALDRLASSRVPAELADWVKAQRGGNDESRVAGEVCPIGGDELHTEAARAVRHRLNELFAFEPYVEQPAAIQELHAMRIAAKHLRYTLEAYAPLYADGLASQIQWGRQLQDWLGEIHDCDVWQTELDQFARELAKHEPRRSRAEPTTSQRSRAPSAASRRGRAEPATSPLLPGIEHLRQQRAARRTAVYEEFRSAWRQAAETGFWDEFRRPFESAPPKPGGGARSARLARAAHDERITDEADCASIGGNASNSADVDGAEIENDGIDSAGIVGDERFRPVLELARSCRYEAKHTHQVTRLAVDLFDQLAALHGLDSERRFWLTSAALLHDVGWIEGRAGHHQTALRLILESPLLPWDDRLRRIVGLIARYHRKAPPRDGDEHFAGLSAADRADVRTLAALLRIADALDYSHAKLVQKVACRATAKRISIRCVVTRAADAECARAVEKGDLASQVFEREIRATWHLH